MLAPGIEDSGLDSRLADMVEHEAHLGTLAYHPNRIRHLMVQDADVESEGMPREELEAVDEIGANAEIWIGLVLDQTPDGAQDLVLTQTVEIGFDRLAALKRKCRHHAGEPLVGPGQVRDPLGF